jgi:hypothetical protein
MTGGQKIRCTFDGCHRTHRWVISGVLLDDGWAYLCDRGPGVKEGYYCPAHADALDAMLEDGSLQRTQARIRAA